MANTVTIRDIILAGKRWADKQPVDPAPVWRARRETAIEDFINLKDCNAFDRIPITKVYQMVVELDDSVTTSSWDINWALGTMVMNVSSAARGGPIMPNTMSTIIADVKKQILNTVRARSLGVDDESLDVLDI